jgi:hypothetical protein
MRLEAFDMLIVEDKKQILEDAGYAYSFDRLSYINRKARKVFSIEFVQDNSEEKIKARINEPAPPPGEWRFYFNAEPSEGVKREFLRSIAQ